MICHGKAFRNNEKFLSGSNSSSNHRKGKKQQQHCQAFTKDTGNHHHNNPQVCSVKYVASNSTLICSPEEKYEAKLIKELGDELQPMSTPGMAVFTLRFLRKNICFFGQFGKLTRLVLITFPSLAKSHPLFKVPNQIVHFS